MKRVVLVLCVAALAACAHTETKPEAPPAPVAAPAPAPAPEPQAAAPAEKSCAADADCGGRQLCVRNKCVDITGDLAECGAALVHFGFDEATLRDDELPLLQRASRCIAAEQRAHATIEGNADERGTAEYNLALGDRRAHAVQKYLEQLGVPAANLRTVSYGKENPLCTEHDEACWAKNRRAALKVELAKAAR